MNIPVARPKIRFKPRRAPGPHGHHSFISSIRPRNVLEPFMASRTISFAMNPKREAQREMPKWCNKMDLTLHDIQFQLCEFDKYERIRNNERGWVARYVPMEKREAPKRLSLLNSAQVESILRESKYYEYFPATNSLKRQRTGISHGHTAGNSPVLSQRK